MSVEIESKIKRVGGSVIDMVTAKYHFLPVADGAHVADVDSDAHIARFLAIPEGFRIYKAGAPAATAEAELTQASALVLAARPPVAPVHDVLYGSSVHPTTFVIHDKDYALGDVVALAQTASGLTIDEWNTIDEDARALAIDAELDKLAEAGPADELAAVAEDLAAERAELAKQFEEKFGKAPHHNTSIETIRKKLAE